MFLQNADFMRNAFAATGDGGCCPATKKEKGHPAYRDGLSVHVGCEGLLHGADVVRTTQRSNVSEEVAGTRVDVVAREVQPFVDER